MLVSKRTADKLDEWKNNNTVKDQEKSPYLEGLVLKDSEEWYRSGPYQNWVAISALTDEGLRLYREACQRAENESPKATLTDVRMMPISCGPWFPDKSSPWYRDDDAAMLNCLNDRILCGETENGNGLETSAVKWGGTNSRGNKWVITKSGSLYFYE